MHLPATSYPCTGNAGTVEDLCLDVLPAKGDPGTAGKCGGLCLGVCLPLSGLSECPAAQAKKKILLTNKPTGILSLVLQHNQLLTKAVQKKD